MESTIMGSPAISLVPLQSHHIHLQRVFLFSQKRFNFCKTLSALSGNGAVYGSYPDPVSALSGNGAVHSSYPDPALSRTVQDSVRQRGSLESLFCYDKSIPEEIIEKPIGTAVAEKAIGDKSPCPDCQAKGVVLCRTCTGCGLYVDSILESQGIIVKVRCLGCGGTGNIMCAECGGRGHL